MLLSFLITIKAIASSLVVQFSKSNLLLSCVAPFLAATFII
jgi:hypothetical protein